MKHLGLFEGIGGFSLAAGWMGWETVAWVEINEFCQKVLKKNFPEAKGYGDIKEFDGTKYRGSIDIITGGFPCQPFSKSGKQRGKGDDRFLWPEMLRVIKEVRPAFVVGENVTGIISLALEQVLSDLEGIGYTCEPPVNIPSGCIGGDSIRERIWILAYSCSEMEFRERMGDCSEAFDRKQISSIRGKTRDNARLVIEGVAPSKFSYTQSDGRSITEPLLLRVSDGVSGKLHGDRLTAIGNAIDPYVALEIFKAIESIKS